jgi:hypothetical protein
MVIARIGVTALTIRESIADRVIVISLNDWNCCFTHNLTSSIGKWTECAKISKAVKSPDPACSGVLEESFESEIIAVDTSEEGNALRGVLSAEIRVL